MELAQFGLVAQSSGGGSGSLLFQLIPFVLIFLIFYVFLIRPEMKKKEEHEEFLSSLKVGDRVVTAGGLVGEVKSLDDETVEVQLNRDTKVTVLREQIQGPESDYFGDDDED